MSNLAQNTITTPFIPSLPKKRRKSTRINYYKMVEQLPPASVLTLHEASWSDYENLLEKVGEAVGLRISYNEGVIEIMTLSPEHENYAEFIKRLVDRISYIFRLKILFFGSATMKKVRRERGAEPDACFYIQSAQLLGGKSKIDFAVDPPPDVVVEIDIYHQSLDKFPIYAALGVSEIWRYDGEICTLHGLENGEYALLEASKALPMLTGEILTGFLNRLRAQDQYDTLLAFEEWLNAVPK